MTVRTQGISGTEIAALFGMSPYKTRFGVYAEKKGLVPPREQTPRMKMGKMLEPVVVKCWEEETGKRVQWKDELIEHPKEALVIGTPDGYAYEKVGDYTRPDGSKTTEFVTDWQAGFEAKTAGLDRAFEWGDDGDQIPRHYIFQCQYYMMLTGLKNWHLAALIGGNDFRRFQLKADEELQALMLEEVRRFWHDHIEPGVPPEIDASAEAKQYLLQRYPDARDDMREATSAEEELVIGIIMSRKERVFIENREETLKNQLKASIGFARGLQSIHGKVTWTPTPETPVAAFVRKAGRTLRVTGKREPQ